MQKADSANFTGNMSPLTIIAIAATLTLLYVDLTSAASVLGTVGGKTFYQERSSKNWLSAKAYCRSLGTKLATIRTPAELSLLMSMKTTLGFVAYWTAARDVHTERQFVWDGECNSTDYVNANGATVLPPDELQYKSALTFYIADVTKEPVFQVTSTSSNYYVLCESV